MKHIRTKTNHKLAKLTHAMGLWHAANLAASIRRMEAKGYTVLRAWSNRAAVPNCYRFADTMCAPYYAFDRKTRTSELVAGQLETRPRGATIPAHIIVDGAQPTPDGWKCLSRTDAATEFVF